MGKEYFLLTLEQHQTGKLIENLNNINLIDYNNKLMLFKY